MKLKIEIIGNRASVFLLDEKRKVISKSAWIDKRDLSEKLLSKIDFLLDVSGAQLRSFGVELRKRGKPNLSIKDISKADFNCDSPYFGKNKKINLEENLSSKNKCGFTSWQIGEITVKTLKFILTKEKN